MQGKGTERTAREKRREVDTEVGRSSPVRLGRNNKHNSVELEPSHVRPAKAWRKDIRGAERTSNMDIREQKEQVNTARREGRSELECKNVIAMDPTIDGKGHMQMIYRQCDCEGRVAPPLRCPLIPAGRMFNLIRQFVQLQDDSSAAAASAPGEEAEPEHYLYFRGIPMPPDDYVAPAGASPNT
eukprot:478606-Hanusia_phi.AAC.2